MFYERFYVRLIVCPMVVIAHALCGSESKSLPNYQKIVSSLIKAYQWHFFRQIIVPKNHCNVITLY